MTSKKYRHGFKAEANRWADDLRDEMESPRDAPLCPWKLAKFLNIPIIKLSGLPDCDQKTYLMSETGKAQFSATVCFDGLSAFILTNDTHAPKRQSSNIAHEIAHVLMRHPPTAPFDMTGARTYLREYEDEAEWLGPALLLSEKAAMKAYAETGGKPDLVAVLSEKWIISEEVIHMRMNVVGAAKRHRLRRS